MNATVWRFSGTHNGFHSRRNFWMLLFTAYCFSYSIFKSLQLSYRLLRSSDEPLTIGPWRNRPRLGQVPRRPRPRPRPPPDPVGPKARLSPAHQTCSVATSRTSARAKARGKIGMFWEVSWGCWMVSPDASTDSGAVRGFRCGWALIEVGKSMPGMVQVERFAEVSGVVGHRSIRSIRTGHHPLDARLTRSRREQWRY